MFDYSVKKSPSVLHLEVVMQLTNQVLLSVYASFATVAYNKEPSVHRFQCLNHVPRSFRINRWS